MAPYDHPSVATTTTTATPTTHNRRLGTYSHRNYKIAHQKVSIDIDLENNVITGSTEIVITPTESVLKYIKLDCRQMEISDVLVNNRRVDFLHLDPLKDEYKDFIHKTNNKSLITSINQHHLYKNNFKNILNGENSEELTIFMPERLKLTLSDPSMINNPPYTPAYRETPGSHKPMTVNDISYTPVLVKIDFVVKNPQNGVHFVGCKGTNLNKSEWHAYTNNSNYGISTSSWVPCIDSMWEKSTWEVDISVPRTVKDIGCTRIIGSIPSGNSNDLDEDDDEEEDDESAEILVVGADFSNQKERPHSTDLSKKVVSYEVFNPTSAHHIGWSVGPFIQCPLINLQEEEEPESGNERDTTQVPSAVYCMRSQRENAINTTIFLYKSIDFYSREFGSFPYTSNALVFVSDIDVDYCGFGGVTIFNGKLLYPTNEIEPIYPTTFTLSVALAEQWAGINVVPKTYNDLWVTIGIANFMAFQFVKKLMGVNEFKFRIKKQSDLICEKDINQRPLATPFLKYPISTKDLGFLKLKSPLVLFILDRRMTKTDKSFGLYRVIPKIFLQAMSGDLPNGCLSTYNFQHVCEKVNHNRLDTFFKQWVYGSGVPIFRVTQRFNKKRMFIEMGIRQVQQQESPKYHPTENTFIDDARKELDNQSKATADAVKDALHTQAPPSSHYYNSSNLFTGPMTIRIHEADGTPYEHIVDLKEGFTKLDIQYNTKYKRLKRNKKKTDKQETNGAEEEENVLLHCLGDTLQSDQEMKDWDLTDWTKEEEDRMSNEAFEWIRIDADFEWICKIHINQPDYMIASQLQQDRDIEAQLESVSYFANSNPSALYSSILLRTVMDSRYYYGVRVEAALGLAKFAKPQVKWIGKTHLMKSFKTLFCFPYSPIPLPNNFVDFPSYFIKKAIPVALSTIKDQNNNVPIDVKIFLLNLLKFNENLNNPYSDRYYIGHLIECISHTLLVNPLIESENALSDVDRKFLKEAVDEISRHQKLDEWSSTVSDQNIGAISMAEKLRLARRGLCELQVDDLLNKTQPSYSDNIRVLAFEGLFDLGALKNKNILEYFFFSLFFETSHSMKARLLDMFVLSVGRAALHGISSELDESELNKEILIELNDDSTENGADDSTGEGFVVVEEGSGGMLPSKKDAIARSSIKGSIQLLRRDLTGFKPFVDILWESVKSPLLSLNGKRDLLDIITVLVQAHDSMIVKFDIPRQKKIIAANMGKGKVIFKREGLFKITFSKKLLFAQPLANGNGSPLTLKGIVKPSIAPATGFKSGAKPMLKPTLKIALAAQSKQVKQEENIEPNQPKSPGRKPPIVTILGNSRVSFKFFRPLPEPSKEVAVKFEHGTTPVKKGLHLDIIEKADEETTSAKPKIAVNDIKNDVLPVEAPKKKSSFTSTGKASSQNSPKKIPRFKSEVRRTKSGPLRYIRISTNRRLVVASSDPFRRKKGTGSAPTAYSPAVKLSSAMEASYSSSGAPAKDGLVPNDDFIDAQKDKDSCSKRRYDDESSESVSIKIKKEKQFSRSPVDNILESCLIKRSDSPKSLSSNEKASSPPSAVKPLPTSPKGTRSRFASSSSNLAKISSSSTETPVGNTTSSSGSSAPSSNTFKKFSLKPGSRQSTSTISATGNNSSVGNSGSVSSKLSSKYSNSTSTKNTQQHTSSAYSRQPSRTASPSPSVSSVSSHHLHKPNNERPYSKLHSSSNSSSVQERQRPYGRSIERPYNKDRSYDRAHERSHDKSRERQYSKQYSGSSNSGNSEFRRRMSNNNSTSSQSSTPLRPYNKLAPPPPTPQHYSQSFGSDSSTPASSVTSPPPPPHGRPPPPPPPKDSNSSASSGSSNSGNGFGRTGSGGLNGSNASNGPPKSKLKLKFKF